jgi:hypothetical protein
MSSAVSVPRLRSCDGWGSRRCVVKQLRLLAHLSRWMEAHGLAERAALCCIQLLEDRRPGTRGPLGVRRPA